MTELVYDPAVIGADERYFPVHVSRAPVGDAILADLDMDELGPVAPEKLMPRRFSGFEFPAGDVMHRAHTRASEAGVHKILIVDPYPNPVGASRATPNSVLFRAIPIGHVVRNLAASAAQLITIIHALPVRFVNPEIDVRVVGGPLHHDADVGVRARRSNGDRVPSCRQPHQYH